MHVVHVRQLLQALQDNDLEIHGKKYVWGVPEQEYLGHKILAAGMLPLPSHVAAIQEFQVAARFLRDGQLLQEIPSSIACTLRPLTDELRGGKKGSDKLEWSPAMDAAFAGAKQALLSATHLAHRTVGAELFVDALAMHMGACL